MITRLHSGHLVITPDPGRTETTFPSTDTSNIPSFCKTSPIGNGFGGNKEMLKGVGIYLKNAFSFNKKSIKLCGTPSEIKKDTHWYRSTLNKIIEQLNSGAINPIVATTYPLENASKAHELMESGQFKGKILLTTHFYNER